MLFRPLWLGSVFIDIKPLKMIALGNTMISDDVADKHFVCDLNKCKGACCVEGDAGAPLENEELAMLEEIYPKVKPYLSKEGKKAIEEQGLYVEREGEYETPIIKGRECAYAVYDKQGVLGCGIEKAYNDGEVKFKKPISCHLYPIRITKYDHYDAINYERWHICNCAVKKGTELGVEIYKFLKDPLIRKYGEQWYNELVKLIESKEKQGA